MTVPCTVMFASRVDPSSLGWMLEMLAVAAMTGDGSDSLNALAGVAEVALAASTSWMSSTVKWAVSIPMKPAGPLVPSGSTSSVITASPAVWLVLIAST